MAGKIFFLSGPSGVGKGTVIDALRTRHKDWVFPPSCTTRAPRPGEKDGETYYFISKEEFQRRIKAEEFLEYAEVHGGNFYGTLKQRLMDGVEAGKTVIREFDVQGFSAARERLPRDVYTSIFLTPADNLDVLIQRIKNRAPITDQELEHRIQSMKKELALAHIYDYQIDSYDDQTERLISDVEAVIAQESN